MKKKVTSYSDQINEGQSRQETFVVKPAKGPVRSFGNGLTQLLIAVVALALLLAAPATLHAQQDQPPVDPVLGPPYPDSSLSFTQPNIFILCNDPNCLICIPFGGQEPQVGCVEDWACDLCEWRGKSAIETMLDTVYEGLIDLRTFLQLEFWRGTVEAGLATVTEQLTSTAFTQVAMVGAFFDAKMMNEAKLALDEQYVDARRTYNPSIGLCRFGTATQGLAASERLADINRDLLSSRSLQRELGAKGTLGSEAAQDSAVRLAQFSSRYCNPSDSGGQLASATVSDAVCGTGGGGSSSAPNSDVNLTGTLFSSRTLDVNLTDAPVPDDEINLLALATNLYGQELPPRLEDNAFDNTESSPGPQKQAYHLMRAFLAKGNVAENSFYTIAGQRTKGSGASAQALHMLASSLGMPQQDAVAWLGDSPSYDAQMEVLTKTLYQTPNFVTSLVEQPENVSRQQAAMLAVELMQRRDAYKSMMRQEIMVAMMLDLYLGDRFSEVKGELNKLQKLE